MQRTDNIENDDNVEYVVHPGKPEPDIFLTACKMRGTSPAKSITIEDTFSGVQAGANGKFRLVLEVSLENNAAELQQIGANFVISDAGKIKGPGELQALYLKYSGK